MSVIIDVMGPNITDEEIELLKHQNTSGIIIFTRNIQDKEQLIALTKQMHAINPELIVFADHEGGYVQRIQRQGFYPLPTAHAYGEIYDSNPDVGLAYTETLGERMANELRECGIHVSLAPVLDIHGPNPIIGGLYRAFHKNPEIVTALADAFIKGMHKAGMPSVGKHFPGHGFCAVDSHIGAPIDERLLEALKACDLKPFKALTESGVLDGVMPAHVTYPAIDPAHAAGYSSKWLHEILRGEIGFEGIIISDCLGMTGADIGDLLTRGTQALNAGCNLLIAANQERPVLKAFLDALPTHYKTDNQTYLSGFAEKIRPITQTDNAKPSQPTASEDAQALNPTQTI